MKRLAPVLSTAAGAMTFVVTTVAAGTVLTPLADGALVLAAPIGLGTGMAAMTVVYVGLGDDADSQHYRFALSLGGMGLTFVAVLLGAVVAGFAIGDGFVAGAAAGMIAALGVYAGVGHRRR